MKKIVCLCLLIMSVWTLQAQNQKLRVAVFDPTSSGTTIDEGTKIAVRELISSTFVNTGKYTIVERSLLDKVMKEAAFSNSDNVDESQATELGRLAGANKVVLSVVTLVGGRNMMSIKVIDVKTATVDQQKAKVVNSSDLLDFVEPLTLELMGEQVNYPTPSNNVVTNNNALEQNKIIQPVSKGEEIKTTGEDYAILHIYRPKNFIGWAVSFVINKNGKQLVSLSNNSKSSIKIKENGEVNLNAGLLYLTLNIEFGKEYYLKILPNSFNVMDDSTGKKEFDKVKNQSH